jgi:hypothetical protein
MQALPASHPRGGFSRALLRWPGALMHRVYDLLTVGQPAGPAELIFVLAGMPERKRYGWQLFQRGLAPALLLSVGRHEARFLKERAGLPEDGDIVRLLPIRPDEGNHFLLWVRPGLVCPEVVRLAELNTFGELAWLSAVIRQCGFQHVLILSSDIHLRRIRYAVRTLLGATRVRITYVGVPHTESTIRRQRWWSRRRDIRIVLAEWFKLAGYRLKYGMLRRYFCSAGE